MKDGERIKQLESLMYALHDVLHSFFMNTHNLQISGI